MVTPFTRSQIDSVTFLYVQQLFKFTGSFKGELYDTPNCLWSIKGKMSHISEMTVPKLKQPGEAYETSFNAKSRVLATPWTHFLLVTSVPLKETCSSQPELHMQTPADKGEHGYPLEAKCDSELFLDSNLAFPAQLSCPGTLMECSWKAVCPCTSPPSMEVTKTKSTCISLRLLPVRVSTEPASQKHPTCGWFSVWTVGEIEHVYKGRWSD